MVKTTLKNVKSEVFMYILIVAAVACFIIGGLAFWAHSFTGTMVKTELSAQKIYFPESGSANFSPADYPDLQQYAGQIVDGPVKAKVYANGYIGRHLHKIADGKVYSEVSAEAAKDPGNEKLQQQKQILFQGETLRGMLLTSGYGFGTVGVLAGIAAYSIIALGICMAIAAAVLRTKL